MKRSEANVLYTSRDSEECRGLEGHFGVFLDHAEFDAPDPTAVKFLVESADKETVRVIPDVPLATIALKDVKSVKVVEGDLEFTIAVPHADQPEVVAEYKFILSENEGETED